MRVVELVTVAGRFLPKERLAARFWSKVDTTGECWTWTRATNGSGYGCFGLIHGKSVLAHRVSWELSNHAIPRGLFVLHHCDNRPCVRPTHLYLGTHEDNSRDMVERHRLPGGYHTHNAKISQEIADEIRLRLNTERVQQKVLADEYGVSQSTVSLVKMNKIWVGVA